MGRLKLEVALSWRMQEAWMEVMVGRRGVWRVGLKERSVRFELGGEVSAVVVVVVVVGGGPSSCEEGARPVWKCWVR